MAAYFPERWLANGRDAFINAHFIILVWTHKHIAWCPFPFVRVDYVLPDGRNALFGAAVDTETHREIIGHEVLKARRLHSGGTKRQKNGKYLLYSLF